MYKYYAISMIPPYNSYIIITFRNSENLVELTKRKFTKKFALNH